MYNSEFYNTLINDYASRKPNTKISPNDNMNNKWYLEVGVSAVENIALACLSSKVSGVNRILDLPCGHGRVLRHITCMFPHTELHACDLDMDAVDFCAQTFGARPIYSHADLLEVDFGASYDLIWIGSLFTHIRRDLAKIWMAHLVKYLAPKGIIVATTHGRWSTHVHTVAPYIGYDRWSIVMKGYSDEGYGYADYAKEESLTVLPGSYGISLAKPHITIKDIEAIPGVRIFMYRERAWADHQDVVAFGKPSYDEKWPSMKS